MKIVDTNAGFVTNYEVYDTLKKSRSQFLKRKDEAPNIPTIADQVLEYLGETSVINQTPQAIQNCLSATKAYNLTLAEHLQVINLAPTTEVEIHLIVEECPERLSREESLQLLATINSTLIGGEASQQVKKQKRTRHRSERRSRHQRSNTNTH